MGVGGGDLMGWLRASTVTPQVGPAQPGTRDLVCPVRGSLLWCDGLGWKHREEHKSISSGPFTHERDKEGGMRWGRKPPECSKRLVNPLWVTRKPNQMTIQYR